MDMSGGVTDVTRIEEIREEAAGPFGLVVLGWLWRRSVGDLTVGAAPVELGTIPPTILPNRNDPL